MLLTDKLNPTNMEYETLDRPLKELFSAIYHLYYKEGIKELRHDHSEVLNQLLHQPIDYVNTVEYTEKGLIAHTQSELIEYEHHDNLEERVIKRTRMAYNE
jgi:hypothetical protein